MPWPAAKIDGAVVPGEGVGKGTVTIGPALDGGQQFKAWNWPLYRFAGDAPPGDVNGQASGGVWFLVDADGELVR